MGRQVGHGRSSRKLSPSAARRPSYPQPPCSHVHSRPLRRTQYPAVARGTWLAYTWGMRHFPLLAVVAVSFTLASCQPVPDLEGTVSLVGGQGNCLDTEGDPIEFEVALFTVNQDPSGLPYYSERVACEPNRSTRFDLALLEEQTYVVRLSAYKDTAERVLLSEAIFTDVVIGDDTVDLGHTDLTLQ